MKSTRNIIFAIVAIVSLSFVFASCGSGGDDDPYTEASTFVTSIDTLTLTGLKSQTSGGSTYTVSFSGHLPATVFGNLIKSKTTFQNSDCGIGVFGLKALGDTAKISNLKIMIGGTSYTLGTCYATGTGGTLTPDTYEAGDTYLAIAKAYFNAILSAANYKTTVNISLTTNVNIVETNNVTLRVKYYAKYYYKDYN